MCITFENEGSLQGQLTVYRGTRWFSVKHKLRDWRDGPGRLHVTQPKPIYASPTLNKKGEWMFDDHGMIWTLFYPLVGTSLILTSLFWTRASYYAWGFAKGPYQENNPTAERIEPWIHRLVIWAFTNLALLTPWIHVAKQQYSSGLVFTGDKHQK